MALYGWISLLILAISELALFKGIDLVEEFFYLFVWWPYILLLDALIKARKGTSPITSNPWSFINLCIWSVTFWLIFELINLRLQNWHYVNITPFTPIRWLGYTLSFATVLPGIFFTSILVRDSLFRGRCLGDSGELHSGTVPMFPLWIGLGTVSILLPMAWPRYFFPLVWGFTFFILDPLNGRLGAKSLILDYMSGRKANLFSLLLGGLICGFLWEFWNFWAGAKWIYTIPFVGRWKVFEMPVLGFLGFPPFALECFSMYVFVSRIGLGGAGDPLRPDWTPYRGRILVPLLIALPIWFVSFWLIDRCTVISFAH